MGKIELSKRLTMIANMVSDAKVVADIGCDHAYTSIYIIENKLAKKIIAMDVNKGPIEIARKNVKLYGMEDNIDVRLSDGTEKLDIAEADTLLISGMGGALIVRILSMRPEILKACKYLVLSPQSEIFLVRKYLEHIGYEIVLEDMVKDEGKFYVGIKAKNKGCCEDNIRNGFNYGNISIYDRFGKYLLDSKNAVLKEYLEYILGQYEIVLDNLSRAQTDTVKERREEVQMLIRDIKEGMKYYGM